MSKYSISEWTDFTRQQLVLTNNLEEHGRDNCCLLPEGNRIIRFVTGSEKEKKYLDGLSFYFRVYDFSVQNGNHPQKKLIMSLDPVKPSWPQAPLTALL